MHDRGIAHRDLKVENILVTDFDHTAVKLVDFGLAGRLRGNGDAFNVSCGTPTFVAPEVLQLDPSYGTSCDLWSLGCVLHVMLSGYLPFRAPSVPQLLALVRRGVVRYNDPVWQLISPSARQLVQRLLTADPRDRPSACEALSSSVWLRL